MDRAGGGLFRADYRDTGDGDVSSGGGWSACGEGVCLVEIALELIAEMADQVGHDDSVQLVGAKNIKFMSPIIPAEGTELRFNLGGEGSERTVEILSGDTLCAKMSLTVA